MSLNENLLDILVCPKCKGPVNVNSEGDGIECKTCRLVYPIKDDIPIMLVDEARVLDEQ